MHEGIDFLVDTGTPVHAAAGGLVVVAQFHPQYGYMIDVDHGNDFATRYAHNSKLLVKAGDLVQRGAVIAESGSTGRSTGRMCISKCAIRVSPESEPVPQGFGSDDHGKIRRVVSDSLLAAGSKRPGDRQAPSASTRGVPAVSARVGMLKSMLPL